MKKPFVLLICSISFLLFTPDARGESFLFDQEEEPNLVVNNRILAKVNDKAISVVDVMKKMDLMFYKQFPEYTSSLDARFQFYQLNWKQVLASLVEKELVMADAAEIKMVVNGGDVRQEMEQLFGPNIIANLDKVGLTYEEAYKMILSDITIRRMIFVRVHSKVLKEVTPLMLKKHYEMYSKENIREPEWHYQVVSIREKDPMKGTETAKLVHELLTSGEAELTTLREKLKVRGVEIAVNISEEYSHKEKELSKEFKEILTKMEEQSYSSPFAQNSRAGSGVVYRIFALKKKIPGGIIPFNEVENELQEQLLNAAIDKQTDAYIAKLKRHFDFQDKNLDTMLAEDFVPFALQ